MFDAGPEGVYLVIGVFAGSVSLCAVLAAIRAAVNAVLS